MGSGQKAWAEELELQIAQDRLLKFRSLSDHAVVNHLVYIKDELERFMYSNPSLTKTQWARVEHCLKMCKELI